MKLALCRPAAGDVTDLKEAVDNVYNSMSPKTWVQQLDELSDALLNGVGAGNPFTSRWLLADAGMLTRAFTHTLPVASSLEGSSSSSADQCRRCQCQGASPGC